MSIGVSWARWGRHITGMACGALGLVASLAAMPAMALDMRLSDFSVTDIEGAPLALSKYDGKAVLIVNTASYCGFRRQMEGMQRLWEDKRHDGLVVLAVPSNDFGGQEPGTEEQIKEFCETSFGTTFPMTSKMRVKGQQAHPLYAWLRDELGEDAAPKWNFHKYLISRDGRPLASFPSGVDPEHPTVVAAVTDALGSTAYSAAPVSPVSLGGASSFAE